MSRRYDDGFEIDLPFGYFYAGAHGVRIGVGGDREESIEMEEHDSGEYRAARRRVRARLRVLRHAFTFLMVNTVLFLIDWASGGGFWVQWVALIWGIFLAWEITSTFITPLLWGQQVEERLIERELRRRRGG